MSTESNVKNAKSSDRGEPMYEQSHVATEKLQQAGQHFVAEPARDVLSILRDYAHDKPDVAAMWCFGLGVVVGWKLRG